MSVRCFNTCLIPKKILLQTLPHPKLIYWKVSKAGRTDLPKFCLILVNKPLLRQTWKHHNQWESLPKLITATKQLQRVKGNILFRVLLGSFCVQVRFGVVANLAVYMILVTSFLDKTLRSIFSFGRKVIPWHSHLVSILSINHHQKLTLSQKVARTIKCSRGRHVRE